MSTGTDENAALFGGTKIDGNFPFGQYFPLNTITMAFHRNVIFHGDLLNIMYKASV